MAGGGATSRPSAFCELIVSRILARVRLIIRSWNLEFLVCMRAQLVLPTFDVDFIFESCHRIDSTLSELEPNNVQNTLFLPDPTKLQPTRNRALNLIQSQA